MSTSWEEQQRERARKEEEQKRRYDRKMNRCLAIVILAIIIMIAVPIIIHLAVSSPANAQFNRKFTAHETMAHDSATFVKMREQVMIIWINMNQTWPNDHENIYSTWWYPDQNYENSLAATDDYLGGFIERIDATITEMNSILAGNKTILQPYNSYYQSTLEALRNETKSAGGLLWAINGAWYLQFAPLAYWAWTIFGLTWIFGLIIISVICLIAYNTPRKD